MRVVFVQASEQGTESSSNNYRPPAGESAGSASKKIKLSEAPSGRYTDTSLQRMILDFGDTVYIYNIYKLFFFFLSIIHDYKQTNTH